MFYDASAFNSDISAWDGSAMTNMNSSAPPSPTSAHTYTRMWEARMGSISRVAVCDGVVGNVPTTIGVCEGGGRISVAV